MYLSPQSGQRQEHVFDTGRTHSLTSNVKLPFQCERFYCCVQREVFTAEAISGDHNPDRWNHQKVDHFISSQVGLKFTLYFNTFSQ